jgi:curved DNA-binding protein CbpA
MKGRVKRNHYETLGVKPDADPTTVKRAYRKKAKQHHPDVGGDTTAFQAIQRAYGVLKDPQKRADYDQFGDASEGKSIREMAEHELCILIVSAVTGLDIVHTDLLARIREQVNQQLRKLYGDIEGLKATAKKFKEAASRLKRKDGVVTFMAMVLENSEHQAEDRIKAVQFNIERGKEILKILDEHEYRMDKEPEIMRGWMTPGPGLKLDKEMIDDLLDSIKSGSPW